MFIKKIIKKFFYTWCSIRDKKVNGHYVVIESDDWGDKRFGSLLDKKSLLDKGFNFNDFFYAYDILEEDEDIEHMLGFFKKIEEETGKKIKLTMNFIMRNIDYKQTLLTNSFCSECFTDSYLKNPKSFHCLDKIKEGVSLGYFVPQLHGLYHVNVPEYLSELQINSRLKECALNNCLTDLSFCNKDFPIAFRDENGCLTSKQFIKKMEQAQTIFENIFSYRSTSYAACNHVIKNKHIKVLSQCGIKLLQCGRFRYDSKGKRHVMFFGRNKQNEFISVRNFQFDGVSYPLNINEIDNIVKNAFKRSNILIIDYHRANFVKDKFGQYQKSLNNLYDILIRLTELYPDIQFLSSPEMISLLE